jgi:hypothetical protein
MKKKVSVLSILGAIFALQIPFPLVSRAAEGAAPVGQEGENRWVPSLAIISGVTVQEQHGDANSFQFEDGSTVPVPLQGEVDGDDLVVSPFVGGSLELMSPAIPIPTRPRFFIAGEIVPTFSSDRSVALDGDPGCIFGPRVGDVCVSEMTTIPTFTFAEDAAQGQGTRTETTIDTLVWGANLGVAFPARLGKRQLRIKPSLGWINYEVAANGLVVDAACFRVNATLTRCTDVRLGTGAIQHGFLRETTLEGSDSQRFNGIGPGLELEMDVYRWGQLGVSLFLGARAYRVLGDRTISFSDSQQYIDELGNDLAVAEWEVEVDPWMYRGNLGIRFQWLGSPL